MFLTQARFVMSRVSGDLAEEQTQSFQFSLDRGKQREAETLKQARRGWEGTENQKGVKSAAGITVRLA